MTFDSDTQLLSLLDTNYNRFEYGLLFGKAGLALYYARLSSNDKKYTQIYNELIKDLLTKINQNTAIEFPRGILGIAFAIDLILKFYKKGNPDYILDDIDALIYRSLDLNYKQEIETDIAAEGLFYMTLHIKYGIRGKYKKDIFTHKAIELLEYVYSKIVGMGLSENIPNNIFNVESFFLYSLAILAEQDCYTNRLSHICDELVYLLYSRMPVLLFNRLVRLFLVVRIISSNDKIEPSWYDYANLLRGLINEDKLMRTDCKTNQLGLSDGLTGVYLIMERINKYGIVEPFKYSWTYYKERVEQSSLWNNLESGNMPMYALGLNGLWGIHWCIENRCNENKGS